MSHPRTTLVVILEHFFTWLPDKVYVKLLFRLKMGRRLHLKTPLYFSEKIQWLKLYDRKPEYTQMVDKYAVKEYVAKIIGDEYVIPTLGVWDKIEDIEWEKLPEKFVLKTTQGGGSTGVVICKDKLTFDCHRAVTKLKESLKQDIYRSLKEWPYKNVHRRIIAEQYIEPAINLGDLSDYKWYCFGGEPKFCQVIQDRSSKETIDFFDVNWNHQEFVGLNPVYGTRFNYAEQTPAKPDQLGTQIEIARKLSQGIPFSRIDLYETNGKVYFGEITFFPMSGMGVFYPIKWNNVLGDLIQLPEKSKR